MSNRQTSKSQISNSQRALWTFLISTLVAPALAALVIFLASVIAGQVGRGGPASLLALDTAGQLAWAAQKTVETYVWAAIPAAISGLFAAVVVYLRGGLHWLLAASIAAIVASALAASAGGILAQHITPIAFIAALSGILTQRILKRGRIIT